MKLKTEWIYSKKTEAERLIHCAHQIVVGFYRVNNFIILPYNPNITNANIVTFPNLPYNQIKRFWQKAKIINVNNYPFITNISLLESVTKLLENANLKTINFEEIKKIWTKAEKEILNNIYDILPQKRNIIKKITIFPTSFGTNTSFSLINKKGEIFINLREDQKIATIVEAVITSLTRKDIYQKLDSMWQESEIITDWLITESKLAKIIKKYDKTSFLPTIKGVRIKQQAKLLEESDNFYKKLGLPISQEIFSLNGLTPELNKKPIENLSHSEKIILRLLIQKSGNVLKFDEIANEIFKSDENYSLYAISKNIERLRNKLELNGISGSYIQTLRGQGYVLKN